MSVTRIAVTVPITPNLSSLAPLIIWGCGAVICGVLIGQNLGQIHDRQDAEMLIFAITGIALVQLTIALIREVYGV